MGRVTPRVIQGRLPILLAALVASGVASIINQVSWQRGLKVFLGGSEALSAMTVVFVFMLGLAVGAAACSARASSIRNPLRALALVEVALCLANIVVALLLSTDISETIYGMQRAAVAAGIPLRALYVVGSIGVLGVPCALMGVTIPLASEAYQRQLNGARASLVNVLLFVNTGGAVIGALVSGFYLLPRYGQTAALAVAAAMNGVAGLVLLASSSTVPAVAAPLRGSGTAPETTSHVAGRAALTPTGEDMTGFFMGMFSLGYEMYLFRAMSLAHQPLPYTFASVLCGFLCAWSLGAFLAYTAPPRHVASSLFAAGLGVALMPLFMDAVRWNVFLPLPIATGIVNLPVIAFGLVYGGLITRTARRWGSDVGRFGAWNTAGACAGILLGTLVGYQVAPVLLATAIAAGIFILFAREFTRVPKTPTAAPPIIWVATAAFVLYALFRPAAPTGPITYAVHSRDGVVEIDGKGNMVWDGLWHSSFSHDDDHVGSANWLLATAPVLVHPGPIEDALVVGVGAGITVGTLAKIGEVRQVDAYDINRGLETIFRQFPRETLSIAQDPKVRLLWQDGRSGLALSPRRYDLITQQPTYLKQAGSTILLSREYFRLVQSRLKPGGVYTIYSNSLGNQAQALMVRETAASVFKHAVTFDEGYLIVASDSPLVATEDVFRARLARNDALGQEMAAYDAAARRAGAGGKRNRPLFERLDRASTWTGGGYVISDDHPLVEYPTWATALVQVPRPR